MVSYGDIVFNQPKLSHRIFLLFCEPAVRILIAPAHPTIQPTVSWSPFPVFPPAGADIAGRHRFHHCIPQISERISGWVLDDQPSLPNETTRDSGFPRLGHVLFGLLFFAAMNYKQRQPRQQPGGWKRLNEADSKGMIGPVQSSLPGHMPGSNMSLFMSDSSWETSVCLKTGYTPLHTQVTTVMANMTINHWILGGFPAIIFRHTHQQLKSHLCQCCLGLYHWLKWKSVDVG